MWGWPDFEIPRSPFYQVLIGLGSRPGMTLHDLINEPQTTIPKTRVQYCVFLVSRKEIPFLDGYSG
jgi:hypothetical protein